jgi:ribonucleoside-diphosphate reductase beta chain
MNERMDRPDYQATSDPAVMESADRGQVELLSYGELYNLWERQQWAVQDIDFTQDRIDWHERIPEEERYQRMYGLSSFFIGEQKVAEELGPMMRACPQEDMRIFLCTQIADEARHVQFFDRFYSEVGVLESDNLADRLKETSAHLNENFGVLFDDMLKSRVDRLAREPEDLETLVEAITLYHMVIEGCSPSPGSTSSSSTTSRWAPCPGSWRASETSPVTSTATWPSARASCATWRRRTLATRRPSSAPWWNAARRPTACSSLRGPRRAKSSSA